MKLRTPDCRRGRLCRRPFRGRYKPDFIKARRPICLYKQVFGNVGTDGSNKKRPARFSRSAVSHCGRNRASGGVPAAPVAGGAARPCDYSGGRQSRRLDGRDRGELLSRYDASASRTHSRRRGSAAWLWPADPHRHHDRGRPSSAGCGRLEGGRACARTRRCCYRRRSGAGADVGRRIGQLDRAGERRFVCRQTGGDAGAAALRRAYRRDQHRAQTSLAHQGRAAGAPRRSRQHCHHRDFRCAGRRSGGDRLGPDRARSIDAGRSARHRRQIQTRIAARHRDRAQRCGQ